MTAGSRSFRKRVDAELESVVPPRWRSADVLLLFGGTFDPPHVGHVLLPRLAMESTGAEAVIYLPAWLQPFKAGTPPTPGRHRLAMLRLALRRHGWAEIWTDELTRGEVRPGEPTYMIDTVRRLREALGPGPTLRLLLGEDQLAGLDRWREIKALLSLADPVVVGRPGDAADEPPPSLDDGRWGERRLATPRLEVSSTALRARRAAGLPLAGQVDPAVEDYIRRWSLYRG